MKKLNIAYWIVTILIGLFMLYSGVNDAMGTENSKMVLGSLGYPSYFGLFIGVAKILGALAIILPLPALIKEWAYAGLIFDLVGATYSSFAAFPFQPPMLLMFVFLGMLVASYILHSKRRKARGILM